MPQPPLDEQREQRIELEIITDANGPEEQAMGWYNYLEENLQFPFLTRCVRERAISPLRLGDEIEVIGLGPQEEYAHEMFVLTRWDRPEGLAVPLFQLEVIVADEQTIQAVEDWHYWVGQGYQL
jgi:Calcium binding